MLFENPPKNIESLIAKSADLTNKPFVHSVVKINGEYDFEDEDIDLTVNILCRDKEGKRLFSEADRASLRREIPLSVLTDIMFKIQGAAEEVDTVNSKSTSE